MNLLLFFFLVFYIAVIFYDIIPCFRQKKYGQAAVGIVFLAVGFILQVIQILGASSLPSPYHAFIVFIKTYIEK